MSKLDVFPPSIRPRIGRLLSHSLMLSHAARWMVSPPSTAKDIVASMLIPAEYNLGVLDDELFDLAIRFAEHANTHHLAHLSNRIQDVRIEQINRFPGEHYRLLQSIIQILGPDLVVEIGTYTGMSALVMAQALNPRGRLITYDVIPWEQFVDTVLVSSDFSESFQQRVGNLANVEYFSSQIDVMLNADMFFIDGPKDGVFEPKFLKHFMAIRTTPCLMVFDDIRMLHMIELWRSIELNKIDLTSFGHWTGTGLVLFEPDRPTLTSFGDL